MSSGKPRLNPYVGTRAFHEGELLFGRDREVLDVCDLLIAERIVVLCSPSRAGKTSLINAAVISFFRNGGFQIRPIIRVAVQSRNDIESGNRYLTSVLRSLGVPRRAADLACEPDLSTCLDRLSHADQNTIDDRRLRPELLAFDQFEEVLTLDPTDRDRKREFFGQVGKALRNRNRWALFALSEDSLAGLDAYAARIPTPLTNTFRLGLLSERGAREAIQGPASRAKVEFTEPAVTRLVDHLRRVRVQRPDGTVNEQLSRSVDPARLQRVCHRLWQRLPADATQIVPELVLDDTAAG